MVYSIHTYFQGDLSARYWDPMFGNEAASVPVFVGEWVFLPNALGASMCADLNLTTGAATSLVVHFLAYMDAHQVSYNAWSFTPTHLIVDEVGFAPTTMPNRLVCSPRLTAAGMGALYKAHLASRPDLPLNRENWRLRIRLDPIVVTESNEPVRLTVR